jgi:hypothetical protein
MSISEKVVQAEQSVNDAKDGLVELTKSYEESQDDAMLVAIEEQSEAVEKATQQLETYRKAESALAAKAASFDAPTVVKSSRGERDPVDYVIASALCAFESHVTKRPFEQVMEARYGGDDTLKAVAPAMVKSVTNPAMSNVPTWAQELTRESYTGFMDLLYPEAILPRVPMTRYEFNGFTAINIAGRAETPKIAGAWRKEGDPIVVRRAATMTQQLTPKSMGVISTFTQECLERSTPSIEALIRQWMVTDTSEALDLQFISDIAPDTVQPGGLQHYADSNTLASTGDTAAEITADVKAMLAMMTDKNLGRRPVFIMHPSNLIALNMSLTAVGTPAFPETSNNTLFGIPIVTSTNVPKEIVFLMDAAEFASAMSGPRFLGTDVASIHEESDDVLPLSAGEGDQQVVASPVRSLYQTNSLGLRLTLECDWAPLRDGAVVTLTGVAW